MNERAIKILQKYDAFPLYDESPLSIDDFVDINFVYDLENLYHAFSKLLVNDRVFTRQICPHYKQQARYDEKEPLSIAYIDLILIRDSISSMKVTHNERKSDFTDKIFFDILFRLASTFCDSGSRMLHYIADNYMAYWELTLESLTLVIEKNRTDIMNILMHHYGNKLLITHATDLSLCAINANAINAFIYISLIAEDKIDYKYLLRSLINFNASSYAYEIDVDNKIDFITPRILPEATSFNDFLYVKI